MKKKYTICFLLFFICGYASTKYEWKDYDMTLYRHYKNPAEKEKFIAELKEIVEKGEIKGNVPPGLYAEYGFALYENKRFDDAVIYFGKEYDKWPESRVLMQKMIDASKGMVGKNKEEGAQL